MEQRLDREGFRALFRGSAGSLAFHLELKEAYGVAEEDEPYRRFLAGEPDDYAWRDDYFKLIRDVTSRGVQVRRVRLVSEPLNDYARFLLRITPGNIAAGEDVRYLPRAGWGHSVPGRGLLAVRPGQAGAVAVPPGRPLRWLLGRR
jgi:hypothetical protein